jgi:gamma-glutamylcyclotransferase (GGCT)/AIG2-like uncharacterized protein YtfP
MLIACYGSLLPNFSGADYLGIRDHLKPVAATKLKGRLWIRTSWDSDGLVPAFVDNEEGEVYAFIYEVDQNTLSVIDQFEGFDLDNQTASEYIRKEVNTLDGKKVQAYVCNNKEARINYLRDGDWRKFAGHPNSMAAFK